MLSNRSILERIGTSVATIFFYHFPGNKYFLVIPVNTPQNKTNPFSLIIQAMASDWTLVVAMAFINQK